MRAQGIACPASARKATAASAVLARRDPLTDCSTPPCASAHNPHAPPSMTAKTPDAPPTASKRTGIGARRHSGATTAEDTRTSGRAYSPETPSASHAASPSRQWLTITHCHARNCWSAAWMPTHPSTDADCVNRVTTAKPHATSRGAGMGDPDPNIRSKGEGGDPRTPHP